MPEASDSKNAIRSSPDGTNYLTNRSLGFACASRKKPPTNGSDRPLVGMVMRVCKDCTVRVGQSPTSMQGWWVVGVAGHGTREEGEAVDAVEAEEQPGGQDRGQVPLTPHQRQGRQMAAR